MIVSYNSRCLELGAWSVDGGYQWSRTNLRHVACQRYQAETRPCPHADKPTQAQIPKFSDSLDRVIRAGARAKPIGAAASSNCSHHQNYRFRDSLQITEAQCINVTTPTIQVKQKIGKVILYAQTQMKRMRLRTMVFPEADIGIE
jgi:hypothetical protein